MRLSEAVSYVNERPPKNMPAGWTNRRLAQYLLIENMDIEHDLAPILELTPTQERTRLTRARVLAVLALKNLQNALARTRGVTRAKKAKPGKR